MRGFACAVLLLAVGCGSPSPSGVERLIEEPGSERSDSGEPAPDVPLGDAAVAVVTDAGATLPDAGRNFGGDGGGALPAGEDAGCFNAVPALLHTQDQWPVLYASAPGAGRYAYKRVDGTYPTVLFDSSSGRKTSTAAFAFVALSPDGATALLADPNATGGARVYTVELSSGTEKTIGSGSLRTSALSADRSVIVLALEGGAVLAHDFASGNTLPLFAQSAGGDSAVARHANGRDFLVTDGTRWTFFDAQDRSSLALGPVMRAQLLSAGGGVVYVENDRFVARRKGGAPMDLGPATSGALSHHPTALLVLDALGVARVLRASDSAPVQLGTQVTTFDVSADASRAALVVHPDPAAPYSVVAREIDSGTENVLTQALHPARVKLSHSGQRAVVTTEQQPMSGPPVLSTVKLFNVQTGGEIALSPAVLDEPRFTYSEFHGGGTQLQVFVEDGALRLYDATSGARRYETTRSTVPSEGHYAFWRPADDALFSPVGGYSTSANDLYGYVPALGKETFLGTLASVDCAVGPYAVYRRKLPDAFSSSGPGELMTWCTLNDALSAYSSSATTPSCYADALLFREGLSSPPDTYGQADVGRLVYVHPASGRRLPISEQVTGFEVQGDRLVFSTPRGICSTQWPPR